MRLDGFRINDFILSRTGSSLEPFIITDFIVLVIHAFGLKIDRYRVIQVKYDFFEYYLSIEMALKINNEIINYLEKYLSQLLKYKVEIRIIGMNLFLKKEWNNI